MVGGGISAALPLKCLLQSQIYGSFFVNMLTPFFAIVVTAVLIGPVLVCKRIHEAVRASRPPRRPPVEKVRICHCCRTAKLESWEQGVWHKEQIQKEHGIFQPGPRFIAVLVFVLFGIYPTLVKSIFSIFRCRCVDVLAAAQLDIVVSLPAALAHACPRSTKLLYSPPPPLRDTLNTASQSAAVVFSRTTTPYNAGLGGTHALSLLRVRAA